MDISHKFIGMEGLMEKLPMNKKKATLLKTWKRRFFRAADGWLHYYEVLYKLNKAGYQQTCDRFVLACLFIFVYIVYNCFSVCSVTEGHVVY